MGCAFTYLPYTHLPLKVMKPARVRVEMPRMCVGGKWGVKFATKRSLIFSVIFYRPILRRHLGVCGVKELSDIQFGDSVVFAKVWFFVIGNRNLK